jgi:hypothetical protein
MSTSYSENTFGKLLDLVTHKDIEIFFEVEREETNALEFKSIPPTDSKDALINIIITTIAGYLNSEGGLLIFGAPKGQRKDHLKEKVFLGNPTYTSIRLEKDWLINKITSLISPMPKGIVVKMIQNGDGLFAYLVEVQQSLYKPHQYDGRYYIRLDGQNKPAPHYLVEALVKQVKYPDIRGIVKFGNRALISEKNLIVDVSFAIFNFTAYQNEENVSMRAFLGGGKFIEHTSSTVKYSANGTEMVVSNYSKVLHYGMPQVMKQKIIIDPDKKEQFLLMTFGGKNSPAKYSTYKFDFSKGNTLNVNDMLIEVKESFLFIENGQSDPESTINSFRGRK